MPRTQMSDHNPFSRPLSDTEAREALGLPPLAPMYSAPAPAPVPPEQSTEEQAERVKDEKEDQHDTE